MKRFLAGWMLVVALVAPLSLWAQCPIPNIQSPFAATVQGPGPNGGYPVPITTNTGCPLDVTSSGGLSACVTQCTSPWIVGFGGVSQPVTMADGASVTLGSKSDTALGSGQIASLESRIRSIQQVYESQFGTTPPLGFLSLSGNVSLHCKNMSSGNFNPLSFLPNEALDNLDASLQNPLDTVSYNRVFRDATHSDNLRTPFAFKTFATAVAGNTALWTPSAGKKFRIMRWRYTVTDNATLAAPGALTVTLFDGAAGVTGQADDLFVPALALNNSGQLASSPWIDLGNGYLSVAANNVLNINLSAALVTGTVRVQVCGTEE